MFGRERNGLENDEVALADRIVTLPVNPAFASLNLAQAVVIVAYEWFKLARAASAAVRDAAEVGAGAASEQLLAFFATLERELEKVEFFRPPDKRETMQINLRNIFTRMQPTQQDIQTLHGVIMAIAEGRKGPARGGVLDGEEAEHAARAAGRARRGRVPGERGPVRGLSRLLRRNPTDAERALWEALVKDRRFAGRGFKRQTPVGPHICDFVSFPLRIVIDLVPATRARRRRGARRQARVARRARLRVLDGSPNGESMPECRGDQLTARRVEVRRTRTRCSLARSSHHGVQATLDHFHCRGGAGAQERRDRSHREELEAALGERRTARVGGVAIGAGNLLRLLRAGDRCGRARASTSFDMRIDLSCRR